MVDPATAGVVGRGRRRRVAGLRREELAELAGVSVDYYKRLEQGRHPTASYTVLEAIATALRLPPADRVYLHRIAQTEGAGGVAVAEPAAIRPETLSMLRVLDPMPAALLGPNMDVLAINAGGRRLYADFEALPVEERNVIRWMLFNENARALHGDEWEEIAAETIGMLRLRAGREVAHPDVRRLVAGLEASSEFFRRVWVGQVVSTGDRRLKRFHHPEAGPIEFAVETLSVKHAEDQTVVVLMPAAGSPSERAWRAVMERDAGE
jgi:transcriptional regulator with XRE-family HTH domain